MSIAPEGTRLERGLLALYEQALEQRDWEVAEHLLCALEGIARRQGFSSSTQRAYLRLANTALHFDAPGGAARCDEPVDRTVDPSG